ncbi:MAG: PIG-L family deacetylase [Pseudomonadota bacterium]|nr:PIG-L family deacetylase [Pseudomonadota bacterium]
MQCALQTEVAQSAGFDPADTGIPEEHWERLLAREGEWIPAPAPLIVVSPHPDDEVLGAGGLIHTWASEGRPVTIISVTDGEAAFPTWRGLDRIRRGELQAALRKLCLTHVSVIRIGLPDGRVGEHSRRLRNALLGIVEAPATLIAPYEHDGHPDHDTVGAVCCALARTEGVDVARYPIWSWHHGAPTTFAGARWGKFPLSPRARRAKARAVQCFASQLQPPRNKPIVPPHVLPYFQRAFEAFLL